MTNEEKLRGMKKSQLASFCPGMTVCPPGGKRGKTIFETIPAADVEPVRHGRWADFCGNFYCPKCGYLWEDSGYKTPFCPGCGAKMDLEGEK